MCGLLPKTLTLFMTKICDFPSPIYDLTKIRCPMYGRCCWRSCRLNIIYEGLLLLLGLIDNEEKVASSEHHQFMLGR